MTILNAFPSPAGLVDVLPTPWGGAQVKRHAGPEVERDGYSDVWTYETVVGALAALLRWQGAGDVEPNGWVRHQPSNRRRPHGDASLEEVRE